MVGKIGVGLIDTGLAVLQITDIHHPPDQVTCRILPHRHAHMKAKPVIENIDAGLVEPFDRHATHKDEAGTGLKLVTPGAKLRAKGGKREIVGGKIGEGFASLPHRRDRGLQLVALRRCQRSDPAVIPLEIRSLPDARPGQPLGMNDTHLLAPGFLDFPVTPVSAPDDAKVPY